MKFTRCLCLKWKGDHRDIAELTQSVPTRRSAELKVEASGFRVADAAIAGQAGEALRLLRHAIATGLDPVPIVAVLAAQLRQLIKVGSAGRGSSAQVDRKSTRLNSSH